MYDWTKIRLTISDDMQAAVETLNREAVRIALVVDESNKLLGTITDGDVRRALLRRETMDTKVTKFMNPSPVSATTDRGRGSIFLEMKRAGLLHMPIVDKDRCVVDIKMLQDHLFEKKYDNPVLLMAGGFGKRLRPLTDSLPKPFFAYG